nr:hypothetical protein [Candidatus Microthrix sp.]
MIAALLGQHGVVGAGLGQCPHEQHVRRPVALRLQHARRGTLGSEFRPKFHQHRAGVRGQLVGQSMVIQRAMIQAL